MITVALRGGNYLIVFKTVMIQVVGRNYSFTQAS